MDSLLGDHESPALSLTSKASGLALTLKVSRAIKMSRVWQGVSYEYRSYSLWQTVEIVGFVQQNSEAAACQYHILGNEKNIYSYWYLFLCLVTTDLLKRPTAGSTFNYLALLLFGRNFVILPQ